MTWLLDIITNPYLITGVSSWIIAQILKMIISSFINKHFDIKRIWGDGGMPSGHSATVASLAMLCGLVNGLGTFEFALSTIFAFVVCKDAMGVRQEVGRQAAALNQMQDSGMVSLKRRYNELAGHKPAEVMVGVLLGVLDAAAVYLIFY